MPHTVVNGWKEVDRNVLSAAVSSFSLTGIDNSSDRWRLVWYNAQFVSGSNGPVTLRVEEAGVPDAGSNYAYGYIQVDSAALDKTYQAGQFQIDLTTTIDNDAGEGTNGVMDFWMPTGRETSQFLFFQGQQSSITTTGSSNLRGLSHWAQWRSAGDIDGLQILANNGADEFDKGIWILEKFVS